MAWGAPLVLWSGEPNHWTASIVGAPTNSLTLYTSAYHVTVAQHWQASLGWFAPLLDRYRAHCRKVSTFQSCWCCCNHRIGCIPQVRQFSPHNHGKLRLKNGNWRKEWELEELQKCSEREWKWSDIEGTDFYYPFQNKWNENREQIILIFLLESAIETYCVPDGRCMNSYDDK